MNNFLNFCNRFSVSLCLLGSRAQTSSILVKLQELIQVEKELNTKQALLNNVVKELNALQKMSGK